MVKPETYSTKWESRWGFLAVAVFASLLMASCGQRADPAPKPQAPPAFEYLDAWGNQGKGPGKFDAPVTFAVDALGKVYFVDPGARFVDKFESGGTPLLAFEDPRLRHASGIAVDSGGAIYVADAARGIVMIFFPNGTFLRSFRIPSQLHFSGVLGISVDDTGKLYVPDPARSRIAKYDVRGRLVKRWSVPKDAAPDERPSAVEAAQDGSVFVAYASTGRIEKYSSAGEWITSWIAIEGAAGKAPSLAGFTVAGRFVFTISVSPPKIRVWTLDGKLTLGADLGEHLGTIAAPQIAVTSHDELLVFDPSAPRVFRFRIHL
jgi:DNA-binding beta-propeller fold protein YncE